VSGKFGFTATILLVATNLLWLAAAPGLLAKPALVVSELKLAQPWEHVALVNWLGKPAVQVLSEPFDDPKQQGLSARRLSLLRVEGGALREVAGWTVPEELRWAEPVPRAHAPGAFLVLQGAQWQVAVPRGETLEYRNLCECGSVFSLGKSPLALETPLIADLEGDGRLELLLPGIDGLMVHSFDPVTLQALPLWRDVWSPAERFSEDDGKLEARISFPQMLPRDANRDGVLDLFLIRNGKIEVLLHPHGGPPPGAEFYALDAEAWRRVKALELPPSVLLALQDMEPRGFSSRAAAEQALRNASAESPAYFARILPELRSPLPVYFADATGLSIKEQSESESRQLIAVADMNGDGLPDALELRSTEKGDPFNQKNEIRWYPGQQRGSQFLFADPVKTYFTEGIAFVQLIQPTTRGKAEPTLFLATMEVSLVGIAKAFMLRKVTFEGFLYPWQNGALPPQPPVKGSFTFSVELAEKGTRPMLLMADVDGDGRREFLFNLEIDKLFAFPYSPAKSSFGGDALANAPVPLPRKPTDVLTGDLDGSGRETLLLRYRGKQYSAEEQRTLRAIWMEERPEKK
jgi:hypothetical protein